ncbi:MAG: HNH endonuclease signature motif containing protein [Candidatus Gracilibacteria bacterium]
MTPNSLTSTPDYSTRLTDGELYEKARLYGRNALEWRHKFIGLLPELNRRRLYERKGFGSIFECAFKLAGLSEQQVRTALNLEKCFSDKPALRALLVEGSVSVNKLARVASVASTENEEEWAEAVQNLSQSAVETLVRDQKIMAEQAADQNRNGLLQPLFEAKSLRAQDLRLSTELTKRLLTLQEKGLNVDEILTDLLDKRDQEIAEEKVAISEGLEPTQSRHIPARTKKVLDQEHGSKCSIPSCRKPAEQVHHTQTFALSHAHDPHYLAPLCKDHHAIAHAINLKVQEKRREV